MARPADQGDGARVAPHPRETAVLLGHQQAEQTLQTAAEAGRLAHAWLITGPKGVGKATLAYRFARYLLAGGGDGGAPGLFGADAAPTSLDVPPGSRTFEQVRAGSHPGLMVIERGVDPRSKKLRGEIVVDDVRRLQSFFGLTAADGGWRVAIVDSADELNRNAANALLKVLEEPPQRALLLLVARAPGRLPATVRSRCRRLVLHPLTDAQVAEIVATHGPDLNAEDQALITALAQGSPGRALALAGTGGLELYREMAAILDRLPDLRVPDVYAFADRLARDDTAFRLFTDLFATWLAGHVKALACAGDTRSAPAPALAPWTALWEKAGTLIERAQAVNLDSRQIVVTLFHSTAAAAAGRDP